MLAPEKAYRFFNIAIHTYIKVAETAYTQSDQAGSHCHHQRLQNEPPESLQCK
jgi:hypothetical protein